MKKAYTYKMKLVPANIFAIFIFILMLIITDVVFNIIFSPLEIQITTLLMVFWFILHELLHGIGFIIGGVKRKNIKYGAAFEKGILYTMALQEVSKKGILISLQMPFMVISVLTYIIGIIFNINILVLLSIINFTGAALDIAMFLYIMKLKNITYSETGEPDEFVIISKEDLTKKKSLFFKIIEDKEYKKEDFKFKVDSRLTISKRSLISLIIFILVMVILILVSN